jgi:hypothetical protein
MRYLIEYDSETKKILMAKYVPDGEYSPEKVEKMRRSMLRVHGQDRSIAVEVHELAFSESGFHAGGEWHRVCVPDGLIA